MHISYLPRTEGPEVLKTDKEPRASIAVEILDSIGTFVPNSIPSIIINLYVSSLKC
jgi:hypothetical protein